MGKSLQTAGFYWFAVWYRGCHIHDEPQEGGLYENFSNRGRHRYSVFSDLLRFHDAACVVKRGAGAPPPTRFKEYALLLDDFDRIDRRRHRKVHNSGN